MGVGTKHPASTILPQQDFQNTNNRPPVGMLMLTGGVQAVERTAADSNEAVLGDKRDNQVLFTAY